MEIAVGKLHSHIRPFFATLGLTEGINTDHRGISAFEKLNGSSKCRQSFDFIPAGAGMVSLR